MSVESSVSFIPGRRVSDSGLVVKPGIASLDLLVETLSGKLEAPVYLAREGEPIPFSTHVAIHLGQGVHMYVGKETLAEENIAYLDAVLPFARLAIAGHLAYEDKSIQALKDPLTGLLNRTGAQEFIFEYELKRLRNLEGEVALRNSVKGPQESHETSGPGLALVLLDIDNFGRYNNTHGHQYGDRALQAVARYATELLRKSDRGFRYGGEEIGLVLPNCSTFDAAEKAEQIRHNIEVKTIEDTKRAPTDRQYLPQPLTASFGVSGTSMVPQPQRYEGPLHEWLVLKRADEYMYLAKSNGKNRVVRTYALAELEK